MKVAIYDIETYPNIFTVVFYIPEKDLWKTYEVSPRRNDFKKLREFLHALERNNYHMVGFNNLAFDYPVIHEAYKIPVNADWKTVVSRIKYKAELCINTDFFNRNAYVIWDRDQHVKQIDLFKMWHFDRKAVSLKMLEFIMRLKDIQELPFDPTKDVPVEDMDKLIEYNKYDVVVTHEFYKRSLKMFQLRVDMKETYGINALNMSNTKMGESILVKELEKVLGKDSCYYYEDGQRHIRKTERPFINLKECILPYIRFNSKGFNLILDFFTRKTIQETKGVFTELSLDDVGEALVQHCEYKENRDGSFKQVESLNVNYKGLNYVFGLGGLHASRHNKTYHSNENWVIVDVDVTSYYPSLAIENRYYAKHLGEAYCDAYAGIKEKRLQHEKGTMLNMALKEALNASYGNSNQEFSPLYDPQYTMTTTISGQLSLCMLVEYVTSIEYDTTHNSKVYDYDEPNWGKPPVEVIQANTDGITCYVHRSVLDSFTERCEDWEQVTKLTLEATTYSKIFLKDVNNYLAVYENGKVKRIGAYQWDLLAEGGERWEKNHSSLIVPKAVEAHLIYGKCYKEFIREHDDIYDFFLRTKIKRSDKLVSIDVWLDEVEQQRITRYYLSTDGVELVKIAPPRKNKKVTDKIKTAWGRALRDHGLASTIKAGKDLMFNPDNIAKIDSYMLEGQPFELSDILGDKEIPDHLLPIFEQAVAICQPEEARTNMEAGRLCTVANTITEDFKLDNIDYRAYEQEIEKLVNGVKEI